MADRQLNDRLQEHRAALQTHQSLRKANVDRREREEAEQRRQHTTHLRSLRLNAPVRTENALSVDMEAKRAAVAAESARRKREEAAITQLLNLE